MCAMLASDDFEGRKPGTPGEEKTVAYLVEQFRKLGLKPGNGESYLQPVPMVEILAGADASLSIAGHNGTVTLAYGKDMVIWTKRAVPEAELKGSELVFVGYGIVAPEYAWNDYAGIDVHGKTVVVLVNDPGYGRQGPQDIQGRRHDLLRTLVLQNRGGCPAGRRGRVARSRWRCGGLRLERGPERMDRRAAGTAAAGRQCGTRGHRRLDTEGCGARVVRRGGARFRGLDGGGGPCGIQGDAHGYSGRCDSCMTAFASSPHRNVIALLPGGKRQHEYVVYTAHWDHLGRDPARPGHNIFNGAIDNASGVAGLLTLAQSFTAPSPRRTARSCFWP